MKTLPGLIRIDSVSGTLALAAGLYSFFIERFWLDICTVRILLPRLPRSFSGFKIVLFSDVHLGFFYSHKNFAQVVDAINLLRPDLICFTGDFLDSYRSIRALEPAIPLLSQLQAPFGKFAVLGNHDYRAGAQHVVQGMKQGGFCLLKNDHAILQKESERLFLIGLDDVLEGNPNLSKAAEGIPDSACKILLAHEPDYADHSKQFPIDLQLSGHSHGGQVRLPLIGPIVTSKLGRKYHTGLHLVDSLTLYTNRGIGTTGLPVRFLCRPEITMILLEQPPA